MEPNSHEQPANMAQEHHQHPHDDRTHHEHDHDHEHDHGRMGRLLAAVPFLHGHSHGEAHVDRAMETSDRGVWALKVSLMGLGATALFQLVIVLLSGSVGLLADSIHNVTDALTAVPLWIAFALAHRPATRRYTYGYGRAEDMAGALIVLMIFFSSLVAGYESAQKFFHPEPLRDVWWVMAAAIVGFVGNEGVAMLRIRIGRQVGSAALVADGQHARVDGWTSLAVLLGAVGSLLGFPLADPIIGILITLVILFVVKDSAVTMWRRLMDAVDPQQVEAVEREARAIPGVDDVHAVRLRWMGHTLSTELHITVNEDLSTWESHQIAEQVRHALFDAQPKLATVIVHVDPCGHSGNDPHARTSHHTQAGLLRTSRARAAGRFSKKAPPARLRLLMLVAARVLLGAKTIRQHELEALYYANKLVQAKKGRLVDPASPPRQSSRAPLPPSRDGKIRRQGWRTTQTMREEPMDNPRMRPYALSAGEGWTYHNGIDFTVKAGELGRGRRLAVIEYTTRRGEEPPDHTHPTEDEIFYVLQGALTFRCGEDTFELSEGGFVFLPRGIEHGYTIRGDSDVRLLVVTAPAQQEAIGGWGGFVADIEAAGELRATPPEVG